MCIFPISILRESISGPDVDLRRMLTGLVSLALFIYQAMQIHEPQP